MPSSLPGWFKVGMPADIYSPSSPHVRACIFDMDGLLIDSEDIYTRCEDILLEKYGKGPLPWSIKDQLQGRPGPIANEIFYSWAKLPVSPEEYFQQKQELWAKHLPESKPLPGVAELLHRLDRTRHWETLDSASLDTADNSQQGLRPRRIHLALATSSGQAQFDLKTSRLNDLFAVFPPNRRVLGDDPRLGRDRGKPLPDIFLLALDTINKSLTPGEALVEPHECLVFEDSILGVQAGQRAGMHVIWCPTPTLNEELSRDERRDFFDEAEKARGVESNNIRDNLPVGTRFVPTLEDFPLESFHIVVPDDV